MSSSASFFWGKQRFWVPRRKRILSEYLQLQLPRPSPKSGVTARRAEELAFMRLVRGLSVAGVWAAAAEATAVSWNHGAVVVAGAVVMCVGDGPIEVVLPANLVKALGTKITRKHMQTKPLKARTDGFMGSFRTTFRFIYIFIHSEHHHCMRFEWCCKDAVSVLNDSDKASAPREGRLAGR